MALKGHYGLSPEIEEGLNILVYLTQSLEVLCWHRQALSSGTVLIPMRVWESGSKGQGDISIPRKRGSICHRVPKSQGW